MVKAGASFLLALRNFSPLWKWSSVSADSATGWKVLCAQRVDGMYRCDENTAQQTTTSASANLDFWGSDISVYGNSTGGMSWTMHIDGSQPQSFSSANNGPSHLLASWHNLAVDRQHTLTLTTDPGSFPTAQFTLERADVTVNTGTSGDITNIYIDDQDPRINYSGFAQFSDYNGMILPPSITAETFHASRSVGESFNVNFNASAIVLYGPCYAQCGEYYVSLDSEEPVAYDGSFQAPTQVGEACVRYLRAGLSANEQHSLTVTVKDADKWTTVDWIQLVQVSGANVVTNSTETPPGSGGGGSGSGGGGSGGDGGGNGGGDGGNNNANSTLPIGGGGGGGGGGNGNTTIPIVGGGNGSGGSGGNGTVTRSFTSTQSGNVITGTSTVQSSLPAPTGGSGGGGGGDASSSSGSSSLVIEKSLSAGAIAGIVLGSVALLCLFLALLLLLLRHKRTGEKASQPIPVTFDNVSSDSGSDRSQKIEQGPDGIDEIMTTPSYFNRGGEYGLNSLLRPPTLSLNTNLAPSTASRDMYAGLASDSSSFPSYPGSPFTPATDSPSLAHLSPISSSANSRVQFSIVTPSSLASENINYGLFEKRGIVPSTRGSFRTRSSRSYLPSTRTGTTGYLPSVAEAELGHSPSTISRQIQLPLTPSLVDNTPTVGVAATLSQVSRDVNRILTQLGSLRITPGEIVDDDHPVMDEILDHRGRDPEGSEPPEYDDDEGPQPRNHLSSPHA